MKIDDCILKLKYYKEAAEVFKRNTILGDTKRLDLQIEVYSETIRHLNNYKDLDELFRYFIKANGGKDDNN